MKFGDKLYELRKKNGYSQEELAEKLGVSRQSVSKWESNTTYPETDKIIQIANLFDCSMDDLINDKVDDVESTLRKNKNNVQNIWNSLLDFITDTVNMFSKMKFSEGFKCIVEMIILSLLLALVGHIITGIASEVIAGIFSFLKASHMNILRETLRSIFNLIWFIIAIITIIYAFKIRYLNNYQKPKEKESNNTKNSTSSDSSTITNNEKPFEFLSTLAQIVIVFIKVIAFFILMGVVFTTIGLVVGLVVMLFHIPVHVLFIWASLLLLAGIVVAIQIIILLIDFIFDKKIKLLTNVIVFVSCVVLAGISIGMITLSISNLEIIRDNSIFNIKTEEIALDYKDNLVVEANGVGTHNKQKYIIDNNMEDNKIIVSRNVDSKYFKLDTYDSEMDKLPVIKVTETYKDGAKEFYEFFIKNLKDNKVYTFDEYGEDSLVIKANEATVNKLRDNLKKLYLVEEKTNNNEIDVTIHQSKVHFKYGLEGEYNGIDDTITYDEDDYTCKREIEATPYGDRIIYICNDVEEED